MIPAWPEHYEKKVSSTLRKLMQVCEEAELTLRELRKVAEAFPKVMHTQIAHQEGLTAYCIQEIPEEDAVLLG